MKKQYISPAILLFQVEPQLMNGFSGGDAISGDDPQVVTVDPDADVPGDEFTSRRGMWDDDDF